MIACDPKYLHQPVYPNMTNAGGNMADDVYLVAVDVAGADGNVADQEKEVLKKIANRLGVDPSKFEF